MHVEQELLKRRLREEQEAKAKLEEEMEVDRKKIKGLEALVRRQGSLISVSPTSAGLHLYVF